MTPLPKRTGARSRRCRRGHEWVPLGGAVGAATLPIGGPHGRSRHPVGDRRFIAVLSRARQALTTTSEYR